ERRGNVEEVKVQEALTPPPQSTPPPAPPYPAPVATRNGNGNGDTNGRGNGHSNGHRHEREDDASLVAILRVLAGAPPGGQRFSLVRAARHYGRDAIEAHPEELAALPEELPVRLIRAAPHQTAPEPTAPSQVARPR